MFWAGVEGDSADIKPRCSFLQVDACGFLEVALTSNFFAVITGCAAEEVEERLGASLDQHRATLVHCVQRAGC